MWFVITLMLVCGSRPDNRDVCITSRDERPAPSEVDARRLCKLLLKDSELGIIECEVELRALERMQ